MECTPLRSSLDVVSISYPCTHAHVSGQQTSSTQITQHKLQTREGHKEVNWVISEWSNTKKGGGKGKKNKNKKKTHRVSLRQSHIGPSRKVYLAMKWSISATLPQHTRHQSIWTNKEAYKNSPSEIDPRQDAYYDHAAATAEAALLPSSDHRDSIVSSWFLLASRKKKKRSIGIQGWRHWDGRLGFIFCEACDPCFERKFILSFWLSWCCVHASSPWVFFFFFKFYFPKYKAANQNRPKRTGPCDVIEWQKYEKNKEK